MCYNIIINITWAADLFEVDLIYKGKNKLNGRVSYVDLGCLKTNYQRICNT